MSNVRTKQSITARLVIVKGKKFMVTIEGNGYTYGGQHRLIATVTDLDHLLKNDECSTNVYHFYNPYTGTIAVCEFIANYHYKKLYESEV